MIIQKVLSEDNPEFLEQGLVVRPVDAVMDLCPTGTSLRADMKRQLYQISCYGSTCSRSWCRAAAATAAAAEAAAVPVVAAPVADEQHA